MLKFFCALILFFLLFPRSVWADASLWQITSVDTMKYSRDGARDPNVVPLIPIQVKQVADSGAQYIAIDTPYDDEFLPRLKLWVDEARKDHLKVWFRGNFAGWEGWFDYPRISSAAEHEQKTYRFITQNPELFQDGDIFTPAPEAEAGILGDPRQTGKKPEFNQFLIDSFNNCQSAFTKIKRAVNCGIWSENPDVVKEVITKDTIKKLGGIVAIDDYRSSPSQLASDIKNINQQFDAPVVLGEFGNPIPDLNGDQSEVEQANFLSQVLAGLYEQKAVVYGLNYWVMNGGSTELINSDNTTPRLAYFELQKYYQPLVISGIVKNEFGQGLNNVQITEANNLTTTQTDNNGQFNLVLPQDQYQLSFSRSDLTPAQMRISSQSGQINLVLKPTSPDLWYRLRLWIFQHFEKNI